ncbi:MAG: aspartate aminotransferase family protein, partial [Gammaproteobacteria bacterium]|nr:aspartate aminotransferase family protein [Gammaproteobacteria bacterium]
GTESIFLAMKSIRDWARAERRGGDRPEVLVPYSAHPAFSKAGHLLDLQVTRVPIGPDLRADTSATRAAVGPNTVALVGSAPTFPHGVVDPIEGLATLALGHDLWLHVDACVGGYVLPFVRRLGYPVPAFDFSVAGVRSMSADTHKYGFAAKGASTVLYADPRWHAFQIYDFDDWSYGRYSAPTLAGTRPGGAVAAAWAVMRYLGVEGYTRIVADIMRTRDALAAGIAALPGLHVNGTPEGPILTFSAERLDTLALAAALRARGWYALTGARPACIHLGMLTAVHVPIVERWLADLKDAMHEVESGQTVASGAGPGYGG